MTVEEARVRLRRQLEDTFGVEEASILMDRPPGGWSDLVTNHTLDLKIDALRYELRTEMHDFVPTSVEMANLSVGRPTVAGADLDDDDHDDRRGRAVGDASATL